MMGMPQAWGRARVTIESQGEATIMSIIEAKGLARTFTSRKRTVHAVRGVDLTVEPGEIVGFLGPNGAGKTTTLRMLTTLLQLMYLSGDGEVLRYSPDEADLLATERKLNALWAAISRARETGDFRPRPGKLCDWCRHKALCPAFGGTLPPMPVRTAAVVAEVAEVAAADA